MTSTTTRKTFSARLGPLPVRVTVSWSWRAVLPRFTFSLGGR